MNTAKPWVVLADPVWKGKNPYHDARYVATSDQVTVTEDGMGQAWEFDSPEDVIICTMPDSPEQKEHAQLIAAAPELLAACYHVLNLATYTTEWTAGGAVKMNPNPEKWPVLTQQVFSAIRAAVAKAEGRIKP